jgi:hypothetical protein
MLWFKILNQALQGSPVDEQGVALSEMLPMTRSPAPTRCFRRALSSRNRT